MIPSVSNSTHTFIFGKGGLPSTLSVIVLDKNGKVFIAKVDEVAHKAINFKSLKSVGLTWGPQGLIFQKQVLSGQTAYRAGELLQVLSSTMSVFYSEAKTHEQRRACLCYLLQYQHYNADYTVDESLQLGYPIPLCTIQTSTGYFRTEYHRIFELIKPWFKRHLSSSLQKFFSGYSSKNVEDIRISSSLALPVLKTFFSGTVGILDVKSLNDKNHKTQVLFVPINKEDSLEQGLQKACQSYKLGGLRNKYRDLFFLFSFQVPNVDCTLMWGAKWAAPKKNNSMTFLGLDKIFGSSVYSLLSQAGAVPDRLAVNDFITQELDEKDDFTAALKIMGMSPSPVSKSGVSPTWGSKMDEIAKWSLKDDPGSEIYRDAILKWNACFFQDCGLSTFAAPLLSSEVGIWISKEADIAKWAKAYQNLCEIVMFCIQSFPEKFSKIDFESTLLSTHKLSLSGIHQSVGLFPYAMASIFHVLDHILNRPKFLGQAVEVACVSQNYFETLEMIEKLATQVSVKLQKVDLLDSIKSKPQILVADIHPNNAAKEMLFENDILGWVKQHLTSDPSRSMILILDITLNHHSDQVIQTTFQELNPFIEEGRLEIFGIQSLAKLVQLGADNFSGGVCLYLGNSKDLVFPSPIRHKAVFFGLLTLHFQEIVSRYFEQVRGNTGWMYQTLSKRFLEISDTVWIEKKGKDGEKYKVGFCATDVIQNVDEGTVYVAISLKPLLRLLKKGTKEEEESLVSALRKLILGLSQRRKLPLTGRQSFGFSLSNMSDVCDSIRFSIGVEHQPILEGYADLISDFSYALSLYVAKYRHLSDMATFGNHLKKINGILEGSEDLTPVTVSLFEEGYDDYGDPTSEEIGSAKVCFGKGQFFLDESTPTKVLLDQPRERVKELLVHLVCLGPKSVQVWLDTYSDEPTYSIKMRSYSEGFAFELDDSRRRIKDHESGIEISFEPKFLVTVPNKPQFEMDKVFVMLEEFGTTPVRLTKLKEEFRTLAYEGCMLNHLVAEAYKTDSLLLKFTKKKPQFDYLKGIKVLFQKNGMDAIVEDLNNLDFEKLPLPKGYNWLQQQTPLGSLTRALRSLGAHIIFSLTLEVIAKIEKIEQEECKKAVVGGMSLGLLQGCSKKRTLNLESAEVISKMVLMDPFQRYFDLDLLDEWILDVGKMLRMNPGKDISWLKPYLTAFFPLIQKNYSKPWCLSDTNHSIPLRKIGEEAVRVGFQSLKGHINRLEKEFSFNVKVCLPAHVTAYLELYVWYPLSVQDKGALLDALKSTSSAVWEEWIFYHQFFYLPMDELELRVSDAVDELILSQKNQAALSSFFVGGGCRDVVFSLLDKEPVKVFHKALRWAKITEDTKLILKLQTVCQNYDIDEDLLKEMEQFVSSIKDSETLAV